MDGYEQSTFAVRSELFDSSLSMFVCTVCFKVLNDPHHCKNGHSFCKSCVLSWISRDPSCPTCKDPLRLEDLKLDRTAKDFIACMDVHCELSDQCKWIGPFHKQAEHSLEKCMYSQIPCSNVPCGAMIRRVDVESHNLRSCPAIQRDNCHYCGKVTVSARFSHHNKNCFLKKVSSALKNVRIADTNRALVLYWCEVLDQIKFLKFLQNAEGALLIAMEFDENEIIGMKHGDVKEFHVELASKTLAGHTFNLQHKIVIKALGELSLTIHAMAKTSDGRWVCQAETSLFIYSCFGSTDSLVSNAFESISKDALFELMHDKKLRVAASFF